MNQSPPPAEISCSQVLEFLLDYLEGRLPLAQREVLEQHLKACPDCREYLASYSKTIELGKTSLPASPSIEELRTIPEDLIRAILDARRNLD